MARTREPDSSLKIQMTPLIDVTFLILIFLMVLPFKTLDRKVAAYLPKDVGQAPTPLVLPEKPRITVRLRSHPTTGETRVKLLDSPVGDGRAGFAALDEGIAAIHGRSPEFPGEIDAAAEVPHRDVIRTLDAFLKSGVTEVTFVGAKMPSR